MHSALSVCTHDQDLRSPCLLERALLNHHVLLRAQNFLLEQLATCRGLGMGVPAAVPPELIIYGTRNDFPGEVIQKAYATAEGHFKKKPGLIFVCLLDRGGALLLQTLRMHNMAQFGTSHGKQAPHHTFCCATRVAPRPWKVSTDSISITS